MTTITDLSAWEKDPRLFLFTSLTAGSSHIITATSRMETILKANRIPFQAVDVATDEKARKLWGRRAAKRKLPGLVKEGYVIGDLEEVEDWNEFGELKENIGPVPDADAVPAVHAVQTTLGSLRMHDPASQTASSAPAPSVKPTPGAKASPAAPKAVASTPRASTSSAASSERVATPLVQIAQAKKDAEAKAAVPLSSVKPAGEVVKPETTGSSAGEKTDIVKATEDTKEDGQKVEQPKKDEIKSDESKVPATKPEVDEAKQEDVKIESIKSEEVKAEHVKAEETKEEPRGKEAKNQHDKAEEVKAEESRSEETKAQEPKAQEDAASQAASTTTPPASSGAPLSAVVSPSPSEPVGAPAGTITDKHRGSSVSAAPPEEIKELEEKIKIDEAEEPEEGAVTSEKAGEKASDAIQE